nr:hypothetical protein HK105_001521 [Polyrhizophydium stewartii]
MSEDEVRSLRQQFHALRGAEDAERTDAARNAEEEWMESPGNPNDDRDSGTHTDMLLGLVVGFFMGILVLFWVKEANMYNRRQQLGIVTGLLINFSFGLLRMYYH